MTKVSFKEMKNGTKEDYILLDKYEKKYAEGTADRILKFMSGLTETLDTLDVLADNGIKYVADWVIDDQPQDLIVKNKNRMLALPYTVEMNDVVITAVQNHSSNEIFERGKAQFEQLYKESKQTTKIMSISIHPYLTGVPHRINYLNKLLELLPQFQQFLYQCLNDKKNIDHLFSLILNFSQPDNFLHHPM